MAVNQNQFEVSERSKQAFAEMFADRLGDNYELALGIYVKCGARLALGINNVLLYAFDQGKVEEVLAILEQHYEEHLQFQHPEIMGKVFDANGINQTERMFQKIYLETLGLKPQPPR
ncbi:MAG: hypothetical protein WCW02_04760 [Candidatus Buchananbacteria bacterium]